MEDSHYVGILFAGRTNGVNDCVYVAVNTYWESLSVGLPNLPLNFSWYQVVDTFLEDSISKEPIRISDRVWVRERSVMVFQAGHIYE